jgi:protein disulfide-isomerase A1
MLLMRCCDIETAEHAANMHKIEVPSVVMFMPHDERFSAYDGNLEDLEALDQWINARKLPTVQRLDGDTGQQTMETAADSGKPMLFLFSNNDAEPLEKEMREAAKRIRGRVMVILSGTGSPMEKRMADVAGVDENSLPVVAMIEGPGGGGYHQAPRKYRPNMQGLKAKAIEQFVTDFEKKKLRPWLRSEPLPSKKDMMPPVGVLVGSNFREVAEDTAVDVFIDFYAPWCGHCRKLEPQWKDLGKKLQHVKTLRIMKLDATRNEVEGMTISGYPTIVLFPAGRTLKQEVHYSGSRQPGDMLAWLHKHCHHSFDDTPPVGATTGEPTSGLLDDTEEDSFDL